MHVADVTPLMAVQVLVSDRRIWTQCNMPSEAPRVARQRRRKVRSTVLKAFEMSMKMIAPVVWQERRTWGRREVVRMLSAICLDGRKPGLYK